MSIPQVLAGSGHSATRFRQGADVCYRIYADGEVVHEDDFDERDNAFPYQDDYAAVTVPFKVITYIESQVWRSNAFLEKSCRVI